MRVTLMQQTYEEAQSVLTNNYNEKGFCTVVAIATAFNWSAGKSHRHLAKHGRRHGKSPGWSRFSEALRTAAEKEGKRVKFSKDWNGTTLNKFKEAHPRGTYIVAVYKHVLCLKDGEFQDWTEDTAGKRKIAYRSGMEEGRENFYGIAKIEG